MFHQTHWMSVFATNDELEAHFIAAELEASGIMTRLHQELVGIPAGYPGEITILVDNRDYAQTLALMSHTLIMQAIPA